MANPWAMPWQGKYKGRVAILDDYREGISRGLMKNGIFDLDNNDYTEVPDADTWIHHAWSGDMAAAASYMPKGVNVDVVGYWFPADGRGPGG